MKTKRDSPITFDKHINKYRSICENDFINLHNNDFLNITKFETKTDYTKGYVNIDQIKEISLSPFSYKKKEKICYSGCETFCFT